MGTKGQVTGVERTARAMAVVAVCALAITTCAGRARGETTPIEPPAVVTVQGQP